MGMISGMLPPPWNIANRKRMFVPLAITLTSMIPCKSKWGFTSRRYTGVTVSDVSGVLR